MLTTWGPFPFGGRFLRAKSWCVNLLFLLFPHGRTLEFDPLGTVYEPVEDGVGDGALPDDLVAAGHGQL